MVGILVSFWDTLFSGAMLVSGRVDRILMFSHHKTRIGIHLFFFKKKVVDLKETTGKHPHPEKHQYSGCSDSSGFTTRQMYHHSEQT